jgi:hypothetical protein
MAPQVMYNVLDFWRRQVDPLEPRARRQGDAQMWYKYRREESRVV